LRRFRIRQSDARAGDVFRVPHRRNQLPDQVFPGRVLHQFPAQRGLWVRSAEDIAAVPAAAVGTGPIGDLCRLGWQPCPVADLWRARCVSLMLRWMRREPRRLLVALAVLSTLAAGLAAGILLPDGAAALIQNAIEHLRQAGLPGLVLFGVVQVVLIVSGAVPSSLIGFAAGALYGLVPGFLI